MNQCPLCKTKNNFKYISNLYQVFDDLNNWYNIWPDEPPYEKIECEIQHGQRIGWWYKEDEEYAKQCYGKNEAVKSLYKNPPYTGMIIARDDTELRSGFKSELEIDDCVIIMDGYPVEKCYCASTWISLIRLVYHENLIRIINI